MILQLVTTTDRRGAEVFGTQLGEELTTRGRRVDTVALVEGSTDNRLSLEVLGQTRLGRATLRELRRRARSADVVVGHGSSTLPAAALALAGIRVPFVYRNIGDPGHWARNVVVRARTGVFLRRAAVVVALTEGIGRSLRAAYRVPEHRLVVIPKAVPAADFPPVDAQRRRSARDVLGLDDGAEVVVVLGALSPEKAVEVAIAAAGSVPGVHLVVAGDGPQRRQLEEIAAAAAPGRVRFLGSTDDPSLVLSAADLLVVSSHTEGLPGVLIEAGLTGIPAVTTDVGAVREIVLDGTTGAVVAPGSPELLATAIRTVLSDRHEMGAAARRHCLANFEMSAIADRWEAVIDTVVAGRGR